jgi:hypothetical protein
MTREEFVRIRPGDRVIVLMRSGTKYGVRDGRFVVLESGTPTRTPGVMGFMGADDDTGEPIALISVEGRGTLSCQAPDVELP